MLEHQTKAIVLDRETEREADGIIHLFTEDFGRVWARMKSVRKITSKLAGHFEPNMVVQIRLVEKGQLRAVDGLQIAKLNLNWKTLALVRNLAPEWERDTDLWQALIKAEPNVMELLAHFGFSPEFSSCSVCGRGAPQHFLFGSQEFACGSCWPAFRLGEDEQLRVD